MELIIDHNYLRLAAPTFMHVCKAREVRFLLNNEYICNCKKYGQVGTVACVGAFDFPLHEMTRTIQLLTGGDALYAKKLLANGYYATELVQCCVFQWTKRNNEAFANMIVKEAALVNVTFNFQSQLF